MIEEAGLVAAISGTLGAFLHWVTHRLKADVKKTTTEVTDAIDVSKMREELDVLNKFRADWDSERERQDEAERKRILEENAALKAKLEKRELEDSATSKTSLKTQPMPRGL